MKTHSSPVYIHLDEVDSTSNWLKSNASTLDHGTVVTASAQTAGRGQRGNTWESRPGFNITMSMLLRPDVVDAARQFAVSEAVAMGVVITLQRFLGENAPVAVKWPNDIYWRDRKICGILIENVLRGRDILQSVAGVGLNVNQRVFVSDAPNPVSMARIAGHNFRLDDVLDELSGNILSLCDEYLGSVGGMERLHGMYLKMLWRRDGFYPYRDAASGRRFMARIAGISPSGMLSLEETDGSSHVYAFKEVQALVSDTPL